MAILSAKKFIKMAGRWRKFAAMQRRRISFPRNSSNADGCSTSSSSIVEKGHFVVYTIDHRQCVSLGLSSKQCHYAIFKHV
ncbi:Auxin-responsive protein SAUR68 [Capsicum annuum]|uniref:Auxin-responsive protein SAUR68 n=1 Tax=Capsicum annuum TaxID=4072 RepID=A0A2G2YXX5_CAPAN|nr:Auxin-responsive protein SAUR68 [Capsicum annuum]